MLKIIVSANSSFVYTKLYREIIYTIKRCRGVKSKLNDCFSIESSFALRKKCLTFSCVDLSSLALAHFGLNLITS